MGVVEDLADALAKDAIEAAEKYGDDRLIDDMAKAIGARSQTAEEAFMTAVRVRIAAGVGRKFLDRRIALATAAEAKAAAPDAASPPRPKPPSPSTGNAG